MTTSLIVWFFMAQGHKIIMTVQPSTYINGALPQKRKNPSRLLGHARTESQGCRDAVNKITDVYIDRLLPCQASRTSLRRSHRSRKRNQPGLRHQDILDHGAKQIADSNGASSLSTRSRSSAPVFMSTPMPLERIRQIFAVMTRGRSRMRSA
jgi:hypothetical protein